MNFKDDDENSNGAVLSELFMPNPFKIGSIGLCKQTF